MLRCQIDGFGIRIAENEHKIFHNAFLNDKKWGCPDMTIRRNRVGQKMRKSFCGQCAPLLPGYSIDRDSRCKNLVVFRPLIDGPDDVHSSHYLSKGSISLSI